jgi:hypothetical protein
MKVKSVSALAAFVALALFAVPAGSATTEPVTTQPAIQITISVVVTDSQIRMSRLSARRGWGGHFVIRNRGKKPHSVDIGGLRTAAIKPGRKATIKASFDERGSYPFRVILNNAGRKHQGVFRVV